MAANLTPFPNPYNASVQPLEHSQTPNTQMTYHGGAIVVNDQVVGRIASWTPGQFTRTVTEVREVSNSTWGIPVDNVPGIAEGYNITFTRNEVWAQELEIVLGYGQVWTSLADQTTPFTSYEYLFRGSQPYRTWRYAGCWFTERNPNAWEASGDGRIELSCNLAYVVRQRAS